VRLVGPARWLSDGVGYTSLERSAGGKPGQDIVRYDAETGLKTILVPRRGSCHPAIQPRSTSKSTLGRPMAGGC